MTPTLRKRHFRTWAALVILLPIGFIWAFLSVPQTPPETDFSSHISLPSQLSKLVKEVDHSSLKINLRQEETTEEQQLEIIVKAPLTRPSTWIYVGANNDVSLEGKHLVGILANQGVYRFPLPKDLQVSSILLYDAIKKENWEIIEFN